MKYLLETQAAMPGNWISDTGCYVSARAIKMMRDSHFSIGSEKDGRAMELKLRVVNEVSEILESLK